jgi:hypothetical protein
MLFNLVGLACNAVSGCFAANVCNEIWHTDIPWTPGTHAIVIRCFGTMYAVVLFS